MGLKISKQAREHLENLYSQNYRWFATSSDGITCAFKTKPVKMRDYWAEDFNNIDLGRIMDFSLGSDWIEDEPREIIKYLQEDTMSKQLTESEKGYLQVAYEEGYRYVSTDSNGLTYFYKKRLEKKDGFEWRVDHNDLNNRPSLSLRNFGTSWDDEEQTSIADLLGIVDWSQVKPFTKVLVRDDNLGEWNRAYFVEYHHQERFPYRVTFSDGWVDPKPIGVLYKQCRLANEEESNEVMNELQG